MIWKIILHTGKNPSKAGYWLASVILSILQIAGGAAGKAAQPQENFAT